MNKWETARYLIDAKKNTDSVWYIAENAEQLQFIDLRKKLNIIRDEFYIKCCVVIDEYVASLSGIKKRDLCNSDSVVDRIYYERDKNSAHKDQNYSRREYSSFMDVFEDMKNELIHVRTTCKDCLPDVVTLDFVPYDRELFRFIHHVTADVEEDIMEKKYPFRHVKGSGGKQLQLSVFNDTEDLKSISEEDRSKYAVLFKNGICFDEGIQERQDACILVNALYNKNMWCSVNQKEMKKVKELARLGCFDKYGIIQEPPKDPIIMARIKKILDSPIEEE